MSTTEFSPALSRRRILQGAAWATPAILIATAAPAAAVSGENAGTFVIYSAPRLQHRGDLNATLLDIGNAQWNQPGGGQEADDITSITHTVHLAGTLANLPTSNPSGAASQITIVQGDVNWSVLSTSYSSATNTWTFVFQSALALGGYVGFLPGLVFHFPAPPTPTGTATVITTGTSDGVTVTALTPGGNTSTL